MQSLLCRAEIKPVSFTGDSTDPAPGSLQILASVFRLGVLANIFTRPILVGFLKGVSLSIFLGQIGKVLGFQVTASKNVPKLLEIIKKLKSTKVATLEVTVFSIAVLVL